MKQIICLNNMKPGDKANVCQLKIEGSMRRRLLDIGLVEGTTVECTGKSPAGDPMSFKIRGAVIAIRSEEGRQVFVQKENFENEFITVALAGNPNVGKSTVFNCLTGMKQHTGNWAGKTVALEKGFSNTQEHCFEIVDLPGIYSIRARSAEEELARNYILLQKPDIVIVVCDATCLERNLNFALQILEITKSVILCVNLMDEADAKHIKLDLEGLKNKLRIPVIGMAARSKKGISELMNAMDDMADHKLEEHLHVTQYCTEIEEAISFLEPIIEGKGIELANNRWICLQLIAQEEQLWNMICNDIERDLLHHEEVKASVKQAFDLLNKTKIKGQRINDEMIKGIVQAAENICKDIVVYEKNDHKNIDRRLDKIFTDKKTGYPIMLILLAFIFWLTLSGSNILTSWLADLLFYIQNWLTAGFKWMHAPEFLHGALVLGVYRVTAWVVSVMLPPMAIFFPLFTLLEDSGYLPRIAYNMDFHFKRCRACGKQALTMCMGFGCNAAAVTACRIIDSPRERLLAIITNSFIPCNGRLPTLVMITAIFFTGLSQNKWDTVITAIYLTGFIIISVGVTLLITRVLAGTILKGTPTSYILELPPYRRPQLGRVIVSSVFDRTLHVLGRAVSVAAPVGLLIWILANINIQGTSILTYFAAFLDPLGKQLGLDGTILTAFILGIPANEIVIPIMIMIYLSQGAIMNPCSMIELKHLLAEQGWNTKTAICMMLFMMIHWPCSTTILTIKKETDSIKWTILAFLIPTIVGMAGCFLVNRIAGLLGW